MVINEESTGWLTLEFLDRNENPVTPDSISYRIDCGDIEIQAETSVTPDTSVTIILTSDNNQILEDFANERWQENVVTVVAILGSDKKATDEFKYKIKNLGYIS